MELIYYWIDDQEENLREIELNFGGEYILKYGKSKKVLKIIRNENYIESFFNKESQSEIVNITGIIGKNGAGKSSILNYIKRFFYIGGMPLYKIGEDYLLKKAIIAIKIKEELTIFINDELVDNHSNIIYDKSIKVNIVMYGNKQKDNLVGRKIIEGTEKFKNTACVYMSNVFDMVVPEYNSKVEYGYYDISTNGIIDELEKGLIGVGDSRVDKYLYIDEKTQYISNNPNISSLRKFKLNRIFQQLKYISDSSENYQYINDNKFKLPEEIIVTTDYNYKEEDIFSRYKDDKISIVGKIIYKKLEDEVSNSFNVEIKKKYITYRSIVNRMMISYLDDMDRLTSKGGIYSQWLNDNIASIEYEKVKEKKVTDIIDSIYYAIKKTIDQCKDIDESLNRFKYKTESYEEIKNKHKSYCKFLDNIEKIIFENNNTKCRGLIKPSNMTIGVLNKTKSIKPASITLAKEGELVITLNENSLDDINSLMRMYLNIESTQDFMIFKWRNISSGEYILLDTYSKLYSLKDKIKQKNILLIIDEGELYLHPEWQRQYINILVEYIPKIYKGKSVQIIFASNSPFLASDMPKNNIIALKKDDNGIYLADNISSRETFGANISKLLGESFFMKNTMGDFARHKIESVIDILKHKEVDLEKREYVKKVIDLIEEPIIKRKLYEFYNEKYKDICKIEEIDMQIEMLKKKKADLESEMNRRLEGENQDD